MVVRFKESQLVPTAWKNGGGQTREIVRMPSGSSMDAFDWRASIAEIAVDGPFSTFVGFDRVLVLLSGDGVHLRSNPGIDHRLDRALIPFRFAGENAIDATLIGGSSRDFNIMTRRATTSAGVRIVVARETLPPSSAGVIFVARGSCEVRSIDGSLLLDETAGVWWDGEALAWDVAPRTDDSAIIVVRIDQHRES